MDPDFMIPEDYDVTFKKPASKPMSLDELEKQVQEKNLLDFKIVVALGGEEYTDIVTRLFSRQSKVIAPTKGLALGLGLQRMKSFLNLSREDMLRRITSQNQR
jgi:hypothetical protein